MFILGSVDLELLSHVYLSRTRFPKNASASQNAPPGITRIIDGRIYGRVRSENRPCTFLAHKGVVFSRSNEEIQLPAASLKGTFAKAYSLLTEITAQVGWDMLLKCRSNVFVMEEEYRREKNA